MAFFFLGGFVHLHQLIPLESDVQAEGLRAGEFKFYTVLSMPGSHARLQHH